MRTAGATAGPFWG